MVSECDRIARLGASHRLLVFSFWTGDLPGLSRLHFLTVAKALPPGSRYVLFAYDARISNSMLALLSRCGVDVVAFDLPQLMRENGVEHLLRQTPLSGWWGSVQRLARRRGLRILSWLGFTWLGHYHSVRGFTPRYNIFLGSPPPGAAMLSDYARVLISSIIASHTLYTDIDVAFTRSLNWISEHRSFVYRWERWGFANSALMSVTDDSPVKKGALVNLLKRAGTGKPWIVFSEQNCHKCRIKILPCDRLDPLWSRTRPSGPQFSEFFTRNDDSEQELLLLKNEFDAIHWHNRWSTIPDTGSPYDLWLTEMTS